MKYCLALHGGAGTLAKPALDPDAFKPYQAAMRLALEAGEKILSQNGAAVDAVVATVKALEDCPLFNAGYGAVFTEDSAHELDAAVMEGHTLNAGAIAGARRIRNPILAAHALMRVGQSVFLAGDGADRFASLQGLQPVTADYFSTEFRRDQLRELQTMKPNYRELDDNAMGTVGAVACDRRGNLAAATSTGGTANKQSGRIGDSPVIGAGTYASELCAVSATGKGELFIRRCAAHEVDARIRYLHEPLADAVKSVIADETHLKLDGGIIAIDRLGNICLQQTKRMYRAMLVEGESPTIDFDKNTAKDEISSDAGRATST